VLLAAVSLITLAGCASGHGKLDGTHWKLDVWTTSSVGPRDVPITARFAGGRISGSVGANAYGGSYKVGPGTAFSTGPISATRTTGPEAATRAEAAYLALLRQARSFKVTGTKLTLFDEFGNESMNFAVASE
jgi:heat shock protein HslJ